MVEYWPPGPTVRIVPVAAGAVVVLAGSVMVSPESCVGVRVQVPFPRLVPWLSVAPVGTPAMVMASVSPGSGWTRWASMARGIAVFGGPLAGLALTHGACATGSTVTFRVWVVDAVVWLSSVEMAWTESAKVVAPAGGVIVRPVRSAGFRLQLPSLL